MIRTEEWPWLIAALVVAAFGLFVTLAWPAHRGKAFWPLAFLFFALSQSLPRMIEVLPNGIWPNRFWASWQVAAGLASLFRAASVACLLAGAMWFRPVEATLPSELREPDSDDSRTGRSGDEA